MTSTIAQLLNGGIQSTLIFGDPFTPFKTRIVRPVPHACEPRMQDVTGADYGTRVTKTFQYDADLVLRTFIVVQLAKTPNTSAYVSTSGTSCIEQAEDLGHVLCEEVKFQIGSVTHQKWDGNFLHVLQSLMLPDEQQHEEMTGRTCDGCGHKASLQERPYQNQQFFIEVPAWYAPMCYGHPRQQKQYGNAFPLVACQLSEPQLIVSFRRRSQCFKILDSSVTGLSGNDLSSSSLPVCSMHKVSMLFEYAFLDDTTRQIFAVTPHYFLIRQMQVAKHSVTASSSAHTTSFEPRFNHMVQQLWWYYRSSSSETTSKNEWFNFAGGETGDSVYGVFAGDFFQTMEMKYNGQPRIEALPPQYFRMVQPRVHYSRIPNEFIYVYSFALDPEDLTNRPTGAINMSRIDRFEMVFHHGATGIPSDGTIYCWAVNYNLVLIQNGMSFLSFAS